MTWHFIILGFLFSATQKMQASVKDHSNGEGGMQGQQEKDVVAAAEAMALVTIDEDSCVRLLPAETYARCRGVENSSVTFRSKVSKFDNLVKELLTQVGERANKIETAKLCAIGIRNMVEAEIESRPQKLRDQKQLISYKQEQLEKLKAEHHSIMTVKQEQEALLARLSNASRKY